MSTAFKTPSGGTTRRDKHQLRKDRITAVVALLVVAAVMALLIWLASLGNGGTENYLPMMP